jgi:hypothetical protein
MNDFNQALKTVLAILLALTIAQAFSLYAQQQKRYPVANRIIDEKIKELTQTVGFDTLAKRIGEPDILEEKTVDGVTYYISYHIEAVGTGNPVTEIRIAGYVHCLALLPFISPKLGPTFDYTIANH